MILFSHRKIFKKKPSMFFQLLFILCLLLVIVILLKTALPGGEIKYPMQRSRFRVIISSGPLIERYRPPWINTKFIYHFIRELYVNLVKTHSLQSFFSSYAYRGHLLLFSNVFIKVFHRQGHTHRYCFFHSWRS